MLGGAPPRNHVHLRRWLQGCEIRPRAAWQSLRRLPRYWRDWHGFKRRMSAGPEWPLEASFPCLHDADATAGTASGHYFHQDLHVAQRIFSRKPARHVDVGSRLDGFVAHVAAFRPIEYFDLRVVATNATNIKCRQGDLLDPGSLPVRECESVSCLHVIEHVGLGRYGDRLMPDGWRLALSTLAGMLAPGGVLYVSVPVGRQRIEFNAHRVFAPITIVGAAREFGLRLSAFSWVDDLGAFHPPLDTDAEIPPVVAELDYGCGIFEFTT